MANASRAVLLIGVLLVAVTACASRAPSALTSVERHETLSGISVAGASGRNAAWSGTATQRTGSNAALTVYDCTKAAQQRVRVPQLLSEGKLHRTLRVIEHANRLCPVTAPETWAAEIVTLAEIGRYKAARELAERISKNARSAELRAAVEKALRIVTERDVTMPDTDEAKTPMRRVWRQADVAATNKQYQKASELFQKAWTLWHPKNGRALAAAGHLPSSPVTLQVLSGCSIAPAERSSERLRKRHASSFGHGWVQQRHSAGQRLSIFLLLLVVKKSSSWIRSRWRCATHCVGTRGGSPR